MPYFFWNDSPIPFTPNDTVASALFHHGMTEFSMTRTAPNNGIFCGIGQCQSCLVKRESGECVEACLSPCVEGAHFYAVDNTLVEHD
jgi:hypothetical protein